MYIYIYIYTYAYMNIVISYMCMCIYIYIYIIIIMIININYYQDLTPCEHHARLVAVVRRKPVHGPVAGHLRPSGIPI